MPQIAFFIGAASAGVGAVGVLLAWDRHDRGPSAADDSNLDISDVALYSWIAPITGAQLIKMKTKAPISIPEDGCPNFPDGSPDGDFVDRLDVKPGGTALTSICDVTFDIFDGSTKVYGIAADGETIKFELSDNSVISSEISIQDRPTLQAWEDPLDGFASIINSTADSKEIWRALMTPNQPLEFF